MLANRLCGALVFCAAFVLALRAGPPPREKFQPSKAEERLLKLTNAERKKNELPALKPSPLLFKVARAHSANMARQGKMEHVLDDKTPFQRIKGAGYQYYYAGENIAAGDAPVEEIFKAWMQSEKHRENILNKNFTEIGLGIVPDKKGYLYYTQVFGKPR
jgi:uncharacterized protein YkwD